VDLRRWSIGGGTGQHVIQLLPINDTTITGTWMDSYPYNANSSFALHPQFMNLPAAGVPADGEYLRLRQELNAFRRSIMSGSIGRNCVFCGRLSRTEARKSSRKQLDDMLTRRHRPIDHLLQVRELSRTEVVFAPQGKDRNGGARTAPAPSLEIRNVGCEDPRPRWRRGTCEDPVLPLLPAQRSERFPIDDQVFI